MKPPQPLALNIQGPAGSLELLLEDPRDDESVQPQAFAVVCHPHPLHGGTMHNKVVTTVARTLHELDMPTLRFNFRGVGASEGVHDEGRGEVDDVLAVVAEGRRRWPQAALWLAGFSFGGVMALRAACRAAPPPARLITVAPALTRLFNATGHVPVPPCPWRLIQGDADEVLDAVEVLALARGLPTPPEIVVLPGVGHFFHGKLNELRDAVLAPTP